MENIDPKTAQRVWQRVRGNEPPPEEELLPLITTALQQAADLQSLAAQLPKYAQRLKQAAEEARRCCRCLRGIRLIRSGSCPMPAAVSPKSGLPRAGLQRCIGRSLQLAADLKSRETHREYGSIFQELSLQQSRQCCVLLELLGSPE